MIRSNFSYEIKDYLKKNAVNYTVKELLPILKEKFGKEYKPKVLQCYMIRHEIEYKKINPKKSNSGKPKPIGSERVKADGMVQVKVAPHTWYYKQRLIYEEYYGVKLPEDIYVVFLDQDRNNFDITNLRAITRRESAFMANENLFSKDKDVTETGILIAKLRIMEKEMLCKMKN